MRRVPAPCPELSTAVPLVTTAALPENVLQRSLSAFPPIRQVVRKIAARPSSVAVAVSSIGGPVVGSSVDPAGDVPPVGSLSGALAAEDLPPILDAVPVDDALPASATAETSSAPASENVALPAPSIGDVVAPAPAAPSSEAVAPVDRSLALETISPAAAASAQFARAGCSTRSSDLELNRVARTAELSSIVSNLDAKMKVGAELDRVKAELERVKAEQRQLQNVEQSLQNQVTIYVIVISKPRTIRQGLSPPLPN